MVTWEAWHDLPFLDAPDLPSEGDLQKAILATSPRIAALEARLVAAREAQNLAELDAYPDFSLGIDWTWIGEGNPVQPNSGEDALAVTLAIEIPLQRGAIDGARNQAQAERRQIQELRAQLQWDLLANLQSALAAHEDALRRVDLFENQLLPKAEQTYETTLVAYQSGQAAFQDMLDAARVVLDFRLSTVRAQTDAALAFADLNGLLPATQLTSENPER
jgi:outer membrane protein TolC